MMFKLNYKNVSKNEFEIHEFKSFKKFVDFIDEICHGRNREVIWILKKKGFSDIFISDSYLRIEEILTKISVIRTAGEFWLLEHDYDEEIVEKMYDTLWKKI